MTTTRRGLLALAGAGLAGLAGCTGGDDADAGATAGAAGDDWQSTRLEDVTTGESFTIRGFDRPVVLHTFATWCPTCRGQQAEIKRFLEDAGGGAVAVDLTVEENDDAATLRQHASSNEFGWRFGIAPTEMTGALVDEFGRTVASAPRSPVIVVCPGGATEALGKGVTADEIAAAVDSTC